MQVIEFGKLATLAQTSVPAVRLAWSSPSTYRRSTPYVSKRSNFDRTLAEGHNGQFLTRNSN